MQRVLCLYLPTWAIDLARRDEPPSDHRPGAPGAAPSEPIRLLLDEVAGRQIVAARCQAAAAHGVRVGMAVADARALIGAAPLLIAPHRPQRDAARLRALAVWTMRFAPAAAADPPDGLLLDVSGCERLYHGEPRLMTLVVDAVRALGFRVRAALASTAGCAKAMSRWGRGDKVLVPPGREREAIEPLPVAALGLDEPVRDRLRDLGVRRVSELLALPRADLAARFGEGVLLRIDQVLGRRPEPIRPVRVRSTLAVEQLFDGATKQWEAVSLATRGLVDRLAERLAAAALGARELALTLERLDAAPLTLSLALSHPSRSARHFWALLAPHLERAHLGHGVDAIQLAARQVSRLPFEQLGSPALGAAPGDHRETAGQLIDILAHRLGRDGVQEMETAESHLPEHVFRPRSAVESRKRRPAGVTPHDRPTLLLAPPEPVQAMCLTPDGPVLSVRRRGRMTRVLTCIGPERIEQEWWRTADVRPGRDYFKVQDEAGCWLWVFRDAATRQWFVHGEWA